MACHVCIRLGRRGPRAENGRRQGRNGALMDEELGKADAARPGRVNAQAAARDERRERYGLMVQA